MHIYIYTYTHAHLHTDIPTCTHTYIHAHAHTYTNACMHACIHKYFLEHGLDLLVAQGTHVLLDEVATSGEVLL